MPIYQRTIRREVECTGIGLHSGKRVSLKLKPSTPGSGISFTRTDLPGLPSIKATLDNVIDTHQATTLGGGTSSVLDG